MEESLDMIESFMKLDHSEVTASQVNSLILALSKANAQDLAFKFFVMMDEKGPAPNSQTYSIMRDISDEIGRKDWAEEFAAKI